MPEFSRSRKRGGTSSGGWRSCKSFHGREREEVPRPGDGDLLEPRLLDGLLLNKKIQDGVVHIVKGNRDC